MKRKVIQIAGSTQLISLPRKWALRYGIKKGEELEVTEEGNRIIIGAEKHTSLNSVSLDVSSFDADSIRLALENAYRHGYHEIHLKFNKQDMAALAHIEHIVDGLIGVEIVYQKEGACIIKDLSQGTVTKELDPLLKRMFIMLVESSRFIIEGIRQADDDIIRHAFEKYDAIHKFVNYCIRILNTGGYVEYHKASLFHYTLITVEKIAVQLKANAIAVLEDGYKPESKSSALLEMIHSSLSKSCALFSNADFRDAPEIARQMDNASKRVKKFSRQATVEQALFLYQANNCLDFMRDILGVNLSTEIFTKMNNNEQKIYL